MHPALKILIGALMVVVGVYSSLNFWTELVNLVTAAIGPILIVVGAFIVWLESDELKMRQERENQGVQQQFSDVAETATQETEDEPESVQDDRHECPECGKAFDTERGMHIHQAQKHE